MEKKNSAVESKKKYISEKKNTKVSNESKENIFQKIANYFTGVGKEFKKIRWTSGKDLVKYSLCTLGFVVFFGLYFYGIDWIALLVRSLAK